MHDPSNYRAMSTPHPHADDLMDDITEFSRLLSEARKSCKLANVLVVVNSPFLEADGKESENGVVFSFGDSTRALSMAAFAYGYERRSQEQRMADLIKAGSGAADHAGKAEKEGA